MQQAFQYTATQQNKDPPPYPGHAFSRGFQHNAGYRQSYASSEAGSTDLSLSSCENLSLSMRQDPQGEETQVAALFPAAPLEAPQPAYQEPYTQPNPPNGLEVHTANSSTFYVTGHPENPHLYPAASPAGESSQQQDQQYGYHYHGDLNGSGQHLNRQFSLQQCSGKQSQDNIPMARYMQNPDREPTQNTHYQQQYSANQASQKDHMAPNGGSQQTKKQDQFKKWRHFYVNEKTPLQQYRQFSGDSERSSQDEDGIANHHSSTSSKSATQHTEHSKAQHTQHTPQHFNSKPPKSMEDCRSPSFGNGSMIAKLRQEFCKDNPPDHSYNSVSKTKDMNERTGPYKSNDRIRSATPDFLSNHSDLSKQLPLRPSSARQATSQRQNLSSFKLKPEPLLINNRSKSVSDKQKKSPDLMTKHALSILNREEKLQEEPKNLHNQKLLEKPSELVGSPVNGPSMGRMSQWGGSSEERPCHCASSEALSEGEGPATQPDLRDSNRGLPGQNSPSQPAHDQYHQASDKEDQNSLERCRASELDHAAIATRATQMVERLSAENSSLRQELEGYYSKVCRLQKFEVEIQKITDAYESLVKHSTKRENLDKVMRLRLETEVKKLRENNQDVKDQLEKALCKVDQCGGYALTPDTDARREVREKDAMITKLLVQSREVSRSRDKLEVELATQRACCEEHQNHVAVLEASLKQAHTERFNLQAELQKLQGEESKMQQLQQAFGHLQSAAEKREAIECKLRAKLEEEIRSLKNQKVTKASDTDEGISSDPDCGPQTGWMRQKMRELGESVLRLEVEVAHYKQRYIEEQALRQLSVNTVPRDVKIAALEQTSQETEKLITESKTERLQHLEELYNANRKSAEFEAKVRTLEAQLGEKDAMIRVLEKHTLSLSRTSSVNSLFSPLHSTHPSLPSPSNRNQPLSPALQHRDLARLSIHHAKSSSDGAMLDMSGVSPSSLVPHKQSPDTLTMPAPAHKNNKSLRQIITAQAELFERWKTEDPGDLTRECWQV